VLTSSNKYKCGSIKTAEHLLLSCKKYRIKRKKLFSEIKESLSTKANINPILLYTKIGIKKTLVFLKEISICVRWYQKKLESEEEERKED
jgi:hypothetical protein